MAKKPNIPDFINQLQDGQFVMARWGKFDRNQFDIPFNEWQKVRLFIMRDKHGDVCLLSLKATEDGTPIGWSDYDPRNMDCRHVGSGVYSLVAEEYVLEIGPLKTSQEQIKGGDLPMSQVPDDVNNLQDDQMVVARLGFLNFSQTLEWEDWRTIRVGIVHDYKNQVCNLFPKKMDGNCIGWALYNPRLQCEDLGNHHYLLSFERDRLELNLSLDQPNRLDRKWLERMAKAEDQCPSVSVGGLATDMGLYPPDGSKKIIEFIQRHKQEYEEFIKWKKRMNALGGIEDPDNIDVTCTKEEYEQRWGPVEKVLEIIEAAEKEPGKEQEGQKPFEEQIRDALVIALTNTLAMLEHWSSGKAFSDPKVWQKTCKAKELAAAALKMERDFKYAGLKDIENYDFSSFRERGVQ